MSCIFFSLLFALSSSAFSFRPKAEIVGGRAVLKFGLKRPSHLEISVLDSEGKILKHLASGNVCSEKTNPPFTHNSLYQEISWNFTDDLDKKLPRNAGRYLFRIRVGLRAKLGKIFGPSFPLLERIYGLATDERGRLYVATGGIYLKPVYWIKVFDRNGKYLKTIMPYPPNLSFDKLKGFRPYVKGGKVVPRNFNPLVPQLYDSDLVAFTSNRVKGKGLGILTSDGKICRIGTDGSCIVWEKAPKTALKPEGGPLCLAEDTQRNLLYVSGIWSIRRNKRNQIWKDGTVYVIDLRNGESKPFFSVKAPSDSFWLTERNGWYHFTNWGRKNGCAALHGIFIGPDKKLYICDRINQRIAIVSPEGDLIKSIPVQWPDHVAVNGSQIYVLTRKVIDGYKARNEVRLLKFSIKPQLRLLSSIKFEGRNAPCFAADLSSKPPVLWISNVKGGIVRVEDRGQRFVCTGFIPMREENGPGVVKVWADPSSETVFVNNGWNLLCRYDGITGKGGPIPLKAIDLAVGPDRLLYVFGRRSWREPIYRCDMDFKPVPFSGTGTPTTGPPPKGGQQTVYGRYGTGWSNKGLCVSPDGRIFVRHMYSWTKYYVTVFGPNGLAIPGKRVAGGLIGPVDGNAGGIKVDYQGAIYLGMYGHPKGLPTARRWEGCVVKFLPSGGGRIEKPKGWKPLVPHLDWGKTIVEGATQAYPHLAPMADRGCVCKEARFDIDGFGRLYIPNVLDFCVRIYDNAGNLVSKIGAYGNADCKGEESQIPEPEIPLGWPMGCAVNEKGHLFIADVLNQRIVRVDLIPEEEIFVPLK